MAWVARCPASPDATARLFFFTEKRMSEQAQLGLLPAISNAERALALHAGQEGGPWPLTAECKAVLGVLIYHKGAASAIQIKEISGWTKLSDRVVKDSV